MFSTFKQKLLLGIYIFILISIPIGAYLVSQSTTIKSTAREQTNAKPKASVTPKATPQPTTSLLNSAATDTDSNALASPSPSPSSSEPQLPTSFGPTLSFKANLEGRKQGNQAARLFVGIVEGSLTTNPKFLLNFTVDLPASGQYSNLSLAGLNPGSRYTALLKGPAQIATSAPFTMSPTVTNLAGGEALKLLSGDLNDDNVINSADYAIARKGFGTTPRFSNWNENADLNKDGVINNFDLGLIAKNIGQIGASGAWTSPLPQTSTPSASLTSPVGSPASGGYWIWLPR